jgi:hypothetical protein
LKYFSLKEGATNTRSPASSAVKKRRMKFSPIGDGLSEIAQAGGD